MNVTTTTAPEIAPELPQGWIESGLWVMPSYNREKRALAAIDSCIKAGQSTEGILVCDGCVYQRPNQATWTVAALPERREMAGAMNWAREFMPNRTWYGLLTDGVHPTTQNWDVKMLHAAGERHIAWCDDGWRHGRRIGGIVVFPGWLLDALGWWVLPGLTHLYMDDVWEALVSALNNGLYVIDVKCDYRCANNGREAPDEATSRIFNGVPYADRDKATFRQWAMNDLPAAVKRVKDAWKQRTGEAW